MRTCLRLCISLLSRRDAHSNLIKKWNDYIKRLKTPNDTKVYNRLDVPNICQGSLASAGDPLILAGGWQPPNIQGIFTILSYVLKHERNPETQATEIMNAPLSEMTDAISWQNVSIFTPHWLHSTLWIAGEWRLTGVSHKPRSHIYRHRLRDKDISWCAELSPSGSGRLQLYHKHHHHRFMPHSCPQQFIQRVIGVYSAKNISVYAIYASRKTAELHVLKLLGRWWGVVDVVLEQIWY